jgi:hypothetical protein
MGLGWRVARREINSFSGADGTYDLMTDLALYHFITSA